MKVADIDKMDLLDVSSTSSSDFSSVRIPCLEDLSVFKRRCRAMGIRFEVPSSQNNQVKQLESEEKTKHISNKRYLASKAKKRKRMEYEVEEILDIRFYQNKPIYYIKWKDWDSIFNSWEPLEHLFNSSDLLLEFHTNIKKRILNCAPSPIDEEAIDENNVFEVCTNDYKFLLNYTKKRKELLGKLKSWADEINSQLPANYIPIRIENDYDLEGPPTNFTYINEYKAGEGIVIPDDPLIGCECTESCLANKQNCCVTSQCGGVFAYNKSKRLVVPPGTPIYECNRRCKCGPDCFNRVVQHGPKTQLAIFRTSNGCGWGVKTLQKIKKNQFVMEYVGEIITTEEAEKRGKFYDEEGRTYLFDLDFNDVDCPYTVDAAHFGNISHFMNHSCDPNLIVYGVWIENLDPGMPRLAYFSKRDIARGEELTFDYMMPSKNEVAAKRIICKCGAANCRKFLA